MRKRKKRKLSTAGHILIILCVCLAAVGIYGYTKRTTPLDRLNMTAVQELDKTKVQENVTTDFEDKDIYQLSDYVISGETITLYKNAYDPITADDTLGKNVVLKNVETGEETSFTFGGGTDTGIQTGQLDPGVYEIYIYDAYKKKRACFAQPVTSETLADMRRDKKVKEVILDADARLLEDYGITTDRNYAWLVVTEQAPRVKTADVILDPGGNVYNELSYTTDTIAVPGANEAELSMELATLVAGYLEEAGLRVAFTRTADETPSYYGEKGRAAQGYQSGAKVYLNLAMTSEDKVNRPYFMVSPFVAGTLASRIAYDMRNAGLELDNVPYSDTGDAAVVQDALQQNEDFSYNQFSYTPALRETGGKATYAGRSELISGNQEFQDAAAPTGMIFYFANAASQDSIDYYQAHKDEIARELARGILDYYAIEGGSDETSDQ